LCSSVTSGPHASSPPQPWWHDVWFLAHFANYNATYGSLGAAVGLMMWLWISATVVLLGAELNAEIEHQTARDSTVGGEKPLGGGQIGADWQNGARSRRRRSRCRRCEHARGEHVLLRPRPDQLPACHQRARHDYARRVRPCWRSFGDRAVSKRRRDNTQTIGVKQSVNLFKLGVNYKFELPTSAR
jgi:hypothetical protein